MKYGIAFFPSKNIQDKANSYRKRYDPHYSLITPHLTLKEPFDVDENDLEDTIAKLREVAMNTAPCNLEINKVSTFEPVSNTIYFKVERTDQLEELHNKLYEGALEREKKHKFVPHITIAQQLSHDEFRDVLGRLNMEEIKFEDKVDRFHLLYQLENGSWTVHESFVFGEE